MSDIGIGSSGQVYTSQGASTPPKFLTPSVYLTASGTFTALVGRGYILTAASTITLPSSPSNGDTLIFIADTSSNVVLTANSAHVINIQSTISNYGGTATSAAQGNSITLVYNSNSTSWDTLKIIGTWTLNTFVPSSLSATKYLWIDGSDPLGTGTPPADGTNVLPVDKFSILTFTQATTSKRPIFNTNVQNSLGSLKSTSAAQTFISSSSVLYTANMSFIALVTPSSAASAYIYGSSGASSNPAFISNFGGLSYEWFNAADRYTISAGATGLNLLEVYQTDGSTLVAFLNGTQVFSNVPTVTDASKRLIGVFGSQAGLNISQLTLSEMIFYRSVLTSAQKLNIRRYISQKWGLSIAS